MSLLILCVAALAMVSYAFSAVIGLSFLVLAKPVSRLAAAAQAGADVRSYTRLLDARRDGDDWLCWIAPTGQAGAAESARQEVRAQCVVSATGPW